MRGLGIKEIGGSSRGRHIGSTSDMLPKWVDIRNSHILPNRSDMRSIADIPELSEIMDFGTTKMEVLNNDIDIFRY